MSVKKNLDYIIVLGAHVDGTRMTLALLERARRALLYLEENPGTKAVLSGGKGTGENISEAEAMYRYLTGHGIDGSRLILEEKSTSTKENLAFSLRKIGSCNCSVGVVFSQMGTRNTVTDCSCLSCVSAAVNVYDHVKFISGLCSCQRLTNDYFQGLQTKILIDVSLIDGNFTSSRYKIYSCDRFFSSSGSVIFCASQCSLPPY